MPFGMQRHNRQAPTCNNKRKGKVPQELLALKDGQSSSHGPRLNALHHDRPPFATPILRARNTAIAYLIRPGCVRKCPHYPNSRQGFGEPSTRLSSPCIGLWVPPASIQQTRPGGKTTTFMTSKKDELPSLTTPMLSWASERHEAAILSPPSPQQG